MATFNGEELRAAGFDHYRIGMGSEIWRKVSGGEELLVTVASDGRVLFGRYDEAGTLLGGASYPNAIFAAQELGALYPGADEGAAVVTGPRLRTVDRDTFEAGRAGGDE